MTSDLFEECKGNIYKTPISWRLNCALFRVTKISFHPVYEPLVHIETVSKKYQRMTISIDGLRKCKKSTNIMDFIKYYLIAEE